MEKAVILKNIGAIGRAATKLTKQVQETAVACAIHAVRHGDVTLADQLIDALGKGLRRASLRAWFERHTCMYIPKGKQTMALDKDRAKALRAETDEALTEKLMALPWEEAKPEAPVVSVLDVSVAADKFLDRLQKQANEAGMEVRNRALLDLLVATTAKFHAEEALKSTRADMPDLVGPLPQNSDVEEAQTIEPGLRRAA